MIDKDRKGTNELQSAVVTLLSHAIRRQHLPHGFTFDSELWDRLRDLGGVEAVSLVTAEIERSQAVLKRNVATGGITAEPDVPPKAGFGICDL